MSRQPPFPPVEPLSNTSHRTAFRTLLERCLSIRPSDQLLIVHDESLEQYWEPLLEAICDLEILSTITNIPKKYQRFLTRKMSLAPEALWLPDPLRSAIAQSSAILNLLDGDLDTARVRAAIINHPRSHECRLAHIPGLSAEILATVALTHFDKIARDCELVAWYLGNAAQAEIITRSTDGNCHSLTLNLGEWDNEPLISSGLIDKGSWGNFPPGETFCCPEPTESTGTICINGSLPGHVLEPEEEILLGFRAGQLVSWKGTKSAEDFFDRQNKRANETGDKNWGFLSELGIGLNPRIKRLTGNSLFDEKAAGTIHIAIGDNSTFGHGIKAGIHADLVTQKPDLYLDGIHLLRAGKLSAVELRNYRRQWKAPKSPVLNAERVRLIESNIFVEKGQLWRRLCSAGRIGRVSLAERPITQALAKLVQIIDAQNTAPLGNLLDEYPNIDNHPTQELISILAHYQCLMPAT